MVSHQKNDTRFPLWKVRTGGENQLTLGATCVLLPTATSFHEPERSSGGVTVPSYSLGESEPTDSATSSTPAGKQTIRRMVRLREERVQAPYVHSGGDRESTSTASSEWQRHWTNLTG